MTPTYRVYETAIVFDMCLWLNKNYAWITHQEIFKDICLRYCKDRTIILVFRDGENPELSGTTAIMSQIAQEASIPPDRIIFLTYNKIYAPFAKLEQLNTIDVFAHNPYPPSRHYPINNKVFDKKFSALFGRFSIYRLRLAKFIHDTYKTDTLISFKDYKLHILDQLSRGGTLYDEELKWVEKEFPLPTVDGMDPQGWPLTIGPILEGVGRIYTRFFIDIAVETDVTNGGFITEKTTRNFFFGKPFIVFAGPGYLSNLKKLGFKTFSDFIDERYDLIENTEDRFQAVVESIKTVSNYSLDELKTIAENIKPILEHNRNLLLEKKMDSDRLLWAPSFDNSINRHANLSDFFPLDKAV